ncbi:hypothetical protein JCM14036_25160 [Desulfotomaculum defluvii]
MNLHQEKNLYKYMGKTCEYHVFLNEENQCYYEIIFNSQVEIFLNNNWQKAIFKNAYLRTDYKWEVFLREKKATVIVPMGTKIRIKKDYLENNPRNEPKILGSNIEYINFVNSHKQAELQKIQQVIGQIWGLTLGWA